MIWKMTHNVPEHDETRELIYTDLWFGDVYDTAENNIVIDSS